jgi:AraC family transcriptional activator of pobA
MSKKQLPVLKIQDFNKEFSKPDFLIRPFKEHTVDNPYIERDNSPNNHFFPHSHQHYLLLFFTTGSGVHTIEQVEYQVNRGAAFFMSPSEVHLWTISDDADGYVLLFNSSFYLIDALSKQYFKLPFFRAKNKVRYMHLSEESIREVEPLFKLMYAEYKAESRLMHNIIRSYLDALLYKLANLVEPNAQNNDEPSSMIPALEALIEEHFMEHQPATFYSEKLNILPEHLNKLTKKYIGKTVTTLIQERLITESKRLLAYTGLSVSEVAYQLNFSDNSYFNRFFKKTEKITPEQFRNRF